MGLAEQDLLREIAEHLGLLALERVQPKIDSKTLREAIQLLIEPTGDQGIQARLFIPHYWAVYYHDGRGGFGPETKTYLVFYADAKDDPRLEGGYPIRGQDIRPLTAKEFRTGQERNRERFLRGDKPFMYVVRRVGPATGHPFFTTGMVDFVDEVNPAVFTLVDGFVRALSKEFGSDTGTATFGL